MDFDATGHHILCIFEKIWEYSEVVQQLFIGFSYEGGLVKYSH